MSGKPEQIVQKLAARMTNLVIAKEGCLPPEMDAMFGRALQPLADLIRAAEDAKLAIYEELHAAGTEEVKQHPALKRHSTIYDQLEKALNALDKLGSI